MKTVLYIAFIIAVGALVDAQSEGSRREDQGGDRGGDHGGSGGRRPRPGILLRHQNSSSWGLEVNGINVSQSGFAVERENISSVIIITHSQRDLINISISAASVIYVFDLSDPAKTVSAIKFDLGRVSACYLVPTTTGLTFDGVVQELVNRNDTLVFTALLEVQLNGTGEPLTRAEVASLAQQTPRMGRFCREAHIFQTTAADSATFPAAGAEEEGQRVLTAITLDSKVRVLTKVPALPEGGGHEGGRSTEQPGREPGGKPE